MDGKIYFLILFLHISMLQCYRKDKIKTKAPSGTCKFTGYVPGGNKVVVKRITAPIAKLQGNIMSAVIGNTGKASVLAMHSMNAAKAFGKLSVKFANIAPKLGPCLGMFGCVLGGLTEFTKTKPADILKATNVAIAKLTDEVNDRMDEMKGYVDKKVIDLEKSLIDREYKTLFIFWANCIKERTSELVNACQRDAAKIIIAAKSKFAVSAKKDDVHNVKRIESTLFSFRDYAVLSVMCLKSLVDTYAANANTSEEAKFYYDRYNGELKGEVNSFVAYAERSVQTIVAMHIRNGYGSCASTYKCNGMHQIKKGWWLANVNIADWTECKCVFDPADVSTKTCKYHLTIRKDHAKVRHPYKTVITTGKVNSFSGAAKHYGKWLLNRKAKSYLISMESTIQKYWQNEVLDLIPSWEAVARITSEDKDALYGFNSNEQHNDYLEYSPSFTSKLAIANEMAKTFNNNYYTNLK